MTRIFETDFVGHTSGTNLDSKALLRTISIMPIPLLVARGVIRRHHYLHSMPGGTKLSFGVFQNSRLLGAMTFGVGPYLGYQMVNGASPDDVVTLTRLWLADELPFNSESNVLGKVLRALKRDTSLKFVLAYSDPAVGHRGIIYQSANFVYVGLSASTPLIHIGDGKAHHSRTLAQRLGSHSIRYLTSQGIAVKTVPQSAKHRYVYFLDKTWRSRLLAPVLPYPKKEVELDGNR